MDEELVLRYIVFNLRFAIRFTLFLWDCWSIPYGQLYLVTRYTFLLRSLTVMNFFQMVKWTFQAQKQVKHQRSFLQRFKKFKNLLTSARIQEKVRVIKFSQI